MLVDVATRPVTPSTANAQASLGRYLLWSVVTSGPPATPRFRLCMAVSAAPAKRDPSWQCGNLHDYRPHAADEKAVLPKQSNRLHGVPSPPTTTGLNVSCTKLALLHPGDEAPAAMSRKTGPKSIERPSPWTAPSGTTLVPVLVMVRKRLTLPYSATVCMA